MTNPNTFTVYNASAGSGKTFTLVKEYLLLLLRSKTKDAYKNILAITFTNKAVAEMKSRVIANLNALATKECPGDYQSLMETLVSETGFPQAVIQKKSREILKSILHNYAAFDISTIDRFTHKIIRTFAKDLGIPVNFEVELNISLVLQEAVDRVIDRAGEDKILTKVLLDYTLSKADDDKNWDIARDLFKFAGLLTNENHQKYIRLLKGKTLEDFKDFSIKLRSQMQLTEKEIADVADAFFTIVNEADLERKNFSGGYLFDYFNKLQQKNYNITFGAKWQLNIDDAKLYAKSIPQSKKDLLDQYHSEISLLFKTSRAAIFRREYLKEISKNITPLSLLSEISNEIENIKKERSLILISDFNPTIAAEINNQPAPFIYERLGERYMNYFIDEFQDTSEMQWQNIVPLIDYALSSEHPNNENAGLTLVGDAKQSIYRFRGGRAEQFISLYNQENPFNIDKSVIDLPFNYRSAETIVEFNNSFFEFVSNKFENPTYKDLFESSGQVPKKTFSGYVNISFLEAENVQEEMELHPAKILEIIKDLEAGGMSKNDICVLTRTRKQGFAIANYLSENGISIVSSESLLISNSPEVLFINAMLEFSVNSKDNNLKLEILNYLVQKLRVENPYQIIRKNLQKDNNHIFEWLNDYQITFDLKELQVLSLYEAAEYIIRSFSLIESSDAYLQFYLDFVFENTTKNFGGISAFLEKWEQQKDKLSIVAPKTEHAVQVLTIHKSKGLEFPVVIYPFANTKLRDIARDHLWLPLPEDLNDIPVGYFKASDKMLNWGELEANAYNELLDQSEFDSVNVLYVAFTRASQQLYIISNFDLDKKDQEHENKVSGLLIGFLKSKNKWNGELSYEFGSKNLDNYKREESAKTITQEHYYSSPTRSEAVNIVTKSGSLWDSHQEKAINKGLLVHNILSEIDTSDELPKALEKFSKEENLSGSQLQELEKLLSEVISHPKLACYFSASDIVYREQDIISPNGDILRPDRLNCDQNKLTIIDYKTGNVQPAHKAQMEQYATVLTQMGFEVSNKILVYINNEVSLSFV